MIKTYRFLTALMLLTIVLLTGCSLLDGDTDTLKDEPSEKTGITSYEGMNLDALQRYTSSFVMTFTPDDSALPAWSYTLLERASDSDGAHERTLALDGVPPAQDPGDVTLIQIGDNQYMVGEAVAETGCLIFPSSMELKESFLTPDNLLPPEQFTTGLIFVAEETVSGMEGNLYTFEADALGDFTAVSGEIVVAPDSGIVLRYDFAGDTVDELFRLGKTGHMTWHYELTAVDDDVIRPEAPSDCQVDFPVMADASGLTRLPGLVTYHTNSKLEEIIAFYESVMQEQGWARYSLPATQDENTVLVYALGGGTGQFVNIGITTTNEGSDVEIFLEDRPPAAE